jgi:hypothetical protein
MLSYHACSKCDSRVRRSRLRNVFEFAVSPIIIPWRCSICDRREFKFRFIDMNPEVKGDAEDEPEETAAPAKRPTTTPAAQHSETKLPFPNRDREGVALKPSETEP